VLQSGAGSPRPHSTKLAPLFLSLLFPDEHALLLSRGSIKMFFLTHAVLAPAINSSATLLHEVHRAGNSPAHRAHARRARTAARRLAFVDLRVVLLVVSAQRGVYDRETIYKILDEGFVCHVGFSVDGQPYVIPTLYARAGDAIYFHGSAASRMLRNLSEGIPVCVTVTLTDGFVLARSVFNHSMNYRSVVALGKATRVDTPEEKLEALHAFTEKILPGRWNDARRPSEKELKATSILRLPLREASAKIRSGPPTDDAPDYALPIWAGVIPLQLVPGAPIRDERCDASIPTPAYAAQYRR
jgi:nitroimidazol reductase NimA-like FMN-containing flavoprotein (pyridoxamine 5'-phosphate oxidase superfamily)